MTDLPRPGLPRARGLFALPLGTFAGFAAAFVAAVVVALMSYRSLSERALAAGRVTRSLELISQAQALLATVKDAETGQRGYLLTGAERYLEPYNSALARLAPVTARLRELSGDDAQARERLDALAASTRDKMSELAETIRLRRSGDAAAALAIMESDRSKLAMDQVRTSIESLLRDERVSLDDRQLEWQESMRFSTAVIVGGSLVLLVLILAAAAQASRDYRAQKRQEWLRDGQVGLAGAITSSTRLQVQADAVLAYLAEYLHAQRRRALRHRRRRRLAPHRRLRPAPTPATPSSSAPAPACSARSPRTAGRCTCSDVPAGYLRVASAPGAAPSRELLIAPARVDGVVQGVVELGFFRSARRRPTRSCSAASPRRSASRVRSAKRPQPAARSCSRRRSARPRSCRPSRRSCASPTRSSRSRAAR